MYMKNGIITSWLLYKDNFLTALRVLPKLQKIKKTDLENAVIPLYYARCVEIPAVLNEMDLKKEDVILDIASPRVADLCITKHFQSQVHATDISDYFLNYYTVAKNVCKLDTLTLKIEDGRALTYASDFFTKVFSISVIEHIPNDGDTLAIKEMSRVLKPGGLLVVSIPYAENVYFEEYQKGKFYYDKFSKQNEKGETFFQRHYAEKDLQERLIIPSGLQLIKKVYIGENTKVNISKYIDRKSTRPFLGFLHPLFAKLFLRANTDPKKIKKIGGVVLVLKK